MEGYIPPYKTEFYIRGLAAPTPNRVAKRTATVLINIKVTHICRFKYDAFDFSPVIGFCFFPFYTHDVLSMYNLKFLKNVCPL